MMRKKILAIDDIDANLFTLKSVIESLEPQKYEVVTALSAGEGLAILLKEQIDLILLDVMMPEIDGFETAKMIKSRKKTKDIPIIFVTANRDDAVIERCYQVGGSDYINKPFNQVELLARIALHIKLHEKEMVVRLHEEELEHEVNFDALTQIYNRRMFTNYFEQKISYAKEHKETFVFAICDIDFFKKINDTYGHLVGDIVLKELAQLMKSRIRKGDIVARWGGEEFVLVLDVGAEMGKKIIENLRKHIATTLFSEVGSVSCSFGMTELREDDSVDTIIQRADDALYEAKENGRNRVCQK